MSNINFFTPIVYSIETPNISDKVLEGVDDYFYLGGKKAYVISGKSGEEEKVIVSDELPSNSIPIKFLKSISKIGKCLSYCTIILPVLAFTLKAYLRSKHTFSVLDTKKIVEKDFEISDKTMDKVKELMPQIIDHLDCKKR